MDVAVVGSRGFRQLDIVERWMSQNWREDWHLISGGAVGVDRLVDRFAAANGDSPEIIVPPWLEFPAEKYGKDYAPKMRNRMIVAKCHMLVAFWDGRSTGTAHTIAWAAATGKPTRIIMETE